VKVRSFAPLRAILAALVAAAVSFAPAAVAAQSDTGEIVITVLDASTKKAIANARTILVGPQTISSLTTAAGIIHYTDVPIGIYRIRVLKQGYSQGVSKEFDVLSDRSVDVNVDLAISTGGLKVIGSVTAHSNVSISSSDISDSSPIRRISDSLTDALDKIAGVSITQDATDPNGPVTVSLNGHDESQTSVSLDGIPLSAPGSTANLRAIGSDLFTGSSVSTAAGAGSLGGSVNFRTLQPTQALQVRSSATTGTFDRSNESFAATGSIDSLGIAMEHTDRDANSPLTFRDYEDQSGLTYPHAGESQSIGDFIKFRYRLGDDRTSISGTALSNNQHNYSICAQDVTLLPCGIGPNNENYSRYAFAYGTIQSLVGTVATQLTAYTSSGSSSIDDAGRYALLPNPSDDPNPDDLCAQGFDPGGTLPTGGTAPPVYTPLDPDLYQETACPSLSTNQSLTRGIAYSASISQERHTIALTGNTYTAVNSSVPIAGSLYETAFTTAISSSSYQISDSIKSNDKLTLSPRLSIANTTSLGTSLLGGFAASWRPRTQDTYGASLSVGSSQPNVNIDRSYSDPVSARFDCQAHTAVVSGPGDANGGAQSAVTLDANWTHQFLRSGSQVSVDAFSQVQSGQLITANIQEAGTYYPAGYLQTLYNVYASPNVCGSFASAPSVFVSESVGGTRRIYQGLNASGRIGLGRYVVALPTYTLNIAELTAASPRLGDGPSTTIVGEQLPNRPEHRAGLTIDGLLPKSGIELLGNAQYTGSNNQQNLGPYVIVTGGISHGFGPGIVTLFETNVFNTYGGVYATDADDRPLALSFGGELRTIATPITPRTVSLSYTLAVGGPKPALAIGSVSSRALAQAPPSPQPGASGAPGGGLGRLQAVPPPAGTDPLSLATSRDSCTADAQALATPVFAQLRAYVAAYEAKQTLPDVSGFTIASHSVTGNASIPYYLELRPNLRPPGSPATASGTAGGFGGRAGRGGFGDNRGGPGGGPEGGPSGPGLGGPPPDSGTTQTQPSQAQRDAFRNSPAFKAFRGFSQCSYVTVLSSTEAKAKGIDTAAGRPGLLYVPTIGFVFARPPELPQGGGSLKGSQ
jgi:hypothetical protein